MFETYTGKARGVINFAAREARASYSPTIQSHHLLLGLLRENHIVHRYLQGKTSESEARTHFAGLNTPGEALSQEEDLPLSQEVKRILAFSGEEAARFQHRHVGTEHLLLGTLREENCVATRLLNDKGLSLDRARTLLADAVKQGQMNAGRSAASSVGTPGPE